MKKTITIVALMLFTLSVSARVDEMMIITTSCGGDYTANVTGMSDDEIFDMIEIYEELDCEY
ncbi:MAG: hypothetical protein ACPGRE_10105 [Flavobacteriaceae bacterium]